MNVDLNLVEKLVQKVMEQVDANQELTTPVTGAFLPPWTRQSTLPRLLSASI